MHSPNGGNGVANDMPVLVCYTLALQQGNQARPADNKHMEATQIKPTNAASELKQTPKVIGEFGAGRYSAMMASVFKDSQSVLSLSPEKADKLARNCGSEYGAHMKDIIVTASVSRKVTKDGEVTLRDASSKVKGIKLTWPLFAIRALAYANEAGEFGFKYGQKWEVTPKFAEYLNEL
jgi:hypothetical protein